MKLPCEIVQDLLFLYTDEACSPESKQAVEEHLSECEDCRKRLDAINLPDTIAAGTPEPEPEHQKKVIKNSFRKIRRRWVASVLAVLMLLPIALLTVMGVHEYRGSGFAFTNLDDIYIGHKFMNLLEDEKFEQAAEMLDFESNYQDIMEILAQEGYVSSEIWDVCTINGERYAVWVHSDDTYGYDWKETYTGEEVIELWASLIIDPCLDNILIPEADWDAVVQFLEDTELWWDNTSWPLPYILVETQWGKFYMPDELAGKFMRGELKTAYDLYNCMSYMPYEIYTEAQSQKEQDVQYDYQWSQEHYGPVADMTLEEYTAYMRAAVVRRLEECKEMGISISGVSYAGALRRDKEWDVYMNAEEKFSDGNNYPVTFYYTIRNGKIYEFRAFYSNMKNTDLEKEQGLIADPIKFAVNIIYPWAEVGIEGIIQGSEESSDIILP